MLNVGAVPLLPGVSTFTKGPAGEKVSHDLSNDVCMCIIMFVKYRGNKLDYLVLDRNPEEKVLSDYLANPESALRTHGERNSLGCLIAIR